MRNISKRFKSSHLKAYYRVNMIWDSEANVWVATSDDVPGLVLESDSFDTLISRVKDAIPELLKLNRETEVTKSCKLNPETLKAIKEVEKMEKNPDKYKGYTDVHAMFEEILE